MAPQMLISGCKMVCFLAGLSCTTTVSLAACLHPVVKTINNIKVSSSVL